MNDPRATRPPQAAEPHEPAHLISRSGVGSVALCQCGHLHVNLEYLTLRFEPAAFGELARMLIFAQRRLETDAQLQALVAPPASDADAASFH